MSDKERKLTARQTAFVERYCVHMNATQAAREAGYSSKTANEQGARLLANVSIAAAVEVAMRARAKRNNIDADRVLQEFARVGLADVRKLFNPDGSLKSIDKLDDDIAASIASIEVNELRDGEGFVIGHTKKLRLWDKIASLSKLAQHLGLLDPKLTIKGDEKNPLLLLVKQMNGSAFKPIVETPKTDKPPHDGSNDT